MSIKHIKTIWLGIGFFVAGITGYYAGVDSVTVVARQALFSATEPFVAQVQTKNQQCVVQGGLPDPACTPGAIFADVTREQTCVAGYTKTVRSVSTSLKKKVYQERIYLQFHRFQRSNIYQLHLLHYNVHELKNYSLFLFF